MTVHDLAKMIDHSILQPHLTPKDIKKGCETAVKWNTATICVRPSDVDAAIKYISGSGVVVSTVIGFPHGAHTTEAKVFEAQQAIDSGVKELDMVMNIGRLIGGDYEYVLNDIESVISLAHSNDVIVKVILENAYLNDEQKKKACAICVEAGADFVKTSTGYAPTGATAEDLKLMRECCPPNVRVKAAGGVRSLNALLVCKAIGCARVGATATEAILSEAKKREDEGTLTEATTTDSLDSGY